MIVSSTSIADARLIELEPAFDERGFFARTWCRRELAEQGLCVEIAQESISFNRKKGTLRGLHFQMPPHDEVKIVRCTRGAIFDVIVDLRPQSTTYLRWQSFELCAENYRALYVPKGCAHGFQTLIDETEVHYQISSFYHPKAAAGHRFDDPAFAVVWPLPVYVISDRDLRWPPFSGTKIDGGRLTSHGTSAVD
jgi:dTDP-4-dehydrorhamnose 3,5-epimerase